MYKDFGEDLKNTKTTGTRLRQPVPTCNRSEKFLDVNRAYTKQNQTMRRMTEEIRPCIGNDLPAFSLLVDYGS